MPSPFPGMNPYLEQEAVWHDFHEHFMPAAADWIGSQLDDKYVVRIDDHVYVHSLEEGSRQLVGRGDVAVSRDPLAQQGIGATTLTEAPVQVLLPAVDEERSSYVEIRDRDDWRVLTVIELLSPTNKKPGPHREQYLGKRANLLASPVHFVEIDLLRGGPKMPLEGLPDCDYYALVSRAQDRPRAGLFPIHLRAALPKLPIPLQEPDPEPTLDLQALVHQIYDSARYHIYLYRKPLQPRLNAEDAEWAKQFVPASTTR